MTGDGTEPAVTTDIGPFAIVPLWVLEALPGAANASAIVTFVALYRWTDRSLECWPSHQAIADATGLSIATVKRSLSTLVEIGALQIRPRYVAGSRERSSNEYRILTRRRLTDEPTSAHERPDPSVHQRASNHIHVEPYPRTNTRADDNFDAFWTAYPRSEGKQSARKAWSRLSADDQASALEAIARHVANWTTTKTERRFIPHASSWLNGRRWEDELRHPVEDMSLTKRVVRFALDADKLATTKEHA